MRRALIATVTAGPALLGATAAWAHYPMLEADRAYVDAGEPVTIRYGMGHPYTDDRFDVDEPLRVDVLPPVGRKENLSERLEDVSRSERVREFAVTYTPEKEGDYVFRFKGGIFKELPGGRLTEDYAKVVVHVRGAQIGWDQVVGDPLEIVPLTRPYGIPVGATFRGRVLEHGRPMLGGVVEAETYTDELPERLPELMEYRRAEKTDPDGCFAITLDEPGWWLLSVATDGGPGEQVGGAHGGPAKRAVLWVFVGEWDESMTRDLTAPARAYGTQISGNPDWREDEAEKDADAAADEAGGSEEGPEEDGE